MKKFYILFLTLFTLGYAQAQMIEVTFQVDVNQLALTKKIFSGGIHVVGSFQGWDPAKDAMSDADGDGIWTFTTMIANGTALEFKYNNADAWNGNDESNNRTHTVTDNGGKDILPLVCFNSTSACTNTGVTIRVDMNDEIIKSAFNIATDSVTVAGSFQGWNAGTHRLTDSNGDGVYEINVAIAEGSYEYKFIKNGGTWEGGISGSCVNGGGNRVMNVKVNTTLPTYCFNSCEACKLTGPPKRIQVTFRVNMSNMISQFGKVDTCYVAGSFQGWTLPKANSILLDPDGDGIYEGRDSVDGKSSYEFKYVYGKEWGFDETGLGGQVCATGGGNRKIDVAESDTILTAYCFNTCDDICAPLPTKIKARFKVDLSSEVPSADGVFIKSSFQWPQFKNAVTELKLIDPVNGIFGTDVLDIVPIKQHFVFVNGKTDTEKETAKFSDLGCGFINTVGEHLREVDLTGITDFQDIGYIWNVCEELTGTKQANLNVNMQILPNPFSNSTIIRFDNSKGEVYSLTIVDVLGIEMKTIKNIQTGEVLVNRDQMNTGIYFATLKSSKGNFTTQRIAIQ
ncbi:MAG: T9SS type A sorting domain-containing protein [Saprospiraceae bacterium]